ncbi:molecular chaperone HscC [Salmonella enterica subsp. enterica]|uniref:Molecular chaperone HscC n=1 Tax=Salmonella enterica I TaxID=59201 RepID=A0A379WCK0_SALET|nr:molecular chaperone HscC [Salmonella enterica subsp. enterica]
MTMSWKPVATVAQPAAHAIEQALRDSRLKPEQIDSLVLVGGASQMPLVQRIAVRLFGKLPYQSYDPSTIVALGAATQAACRLRHEDVEEVILTDICPTRWAWKSTDRECLVFSRPSLNAIPPFRCQKWKRTPPCTLSRTLFASGYTRAKAIR